MLGDTLEEPVLVIINKKQVWNKNYALCIVSFWAYLPGCYYPLYFFRPSGRKSILGRVSNRVLNKRNSCVTDQIELVLNKIIRQKFVVHSLLKFLNLLKRPSQRQIAIISGILVNLKLRYANSTANSLQVLE
jgi:hypothetical protein